MVNYLLFRILDKLITYQLTINTKHKFILINKKK